MHLAAQHPTQSLAVRDLATNNSSAIRPVLPLSIRQHSVMEQLISALSAGGQSESPAVLQLLSQLNAVAPLDVHICSPGKAHLVEARGWQSRHRDSLPARLEHSRAFSRKGHPGTRGRASMAAGYRKTVSAHGKVWRNAPRRWSREHELVELPDAPRPADKLAS